MRPIRGGSKRWQQSERRTVIARREGGLSASGHGRIKARGARFITRRLARSPLARSLARFPLFPLPRCFAPFYPLASRGQFVSARRLDRVARGIRAASRLRETTRDHRSHVTRESLLQPSPMIVSIKSAVASILDELSVAERKKRERERDAEERASKCDFRRLWIGESAFTSASSALEPVCEPY